MSSIPEPPVTRPIRRLRVVPDAAVPARSAPVRTRGRHRKPDTGELPVAGEPATTDVVPAHPAVRSIVAPPRS